MNKPTKILALAGSARKASWNRKLLRIAVEATEQAGATVTVVDFRTHPLPLYDGDLEDELGLPENVLRLKQQMAESDGLLITSPEYNGFITPLLKNAIDWASRSPAGNDHPLECYRGKVAAILSASPGALGGMRGLVHVRQLLTNLGTVVLPEQVTVGSAFKAFDDEGVLTEKRKQEQVYSLCQRLVDVAGRLA